MRKSGNAMWCVHKHLSSALVHAYETSQKLDREGSNVSMATRIEANEMFSDVVAAEKHIKKEIVPQLVAKGEIEKANKLSKLSDALRDARQGLAQTNIFFLNDEMTIEGNPSIEVDSASARLETLLKKADEFAPMMEQEQMDCPRCEEDAMSIAKAYSNIKSDNGITIPDKVELLKVHKVHESSQSPIKAGSPKDLFRSIPTPIQLLKEGVGLLKEIRQGGGING